MYKAASVKRSIARHTEEDCKPDQAAYGRNQQDLDCDSLLKMEQGLESQLETRAAILITYGIVDWHFTCKNRPRSPG